MEYDSGEQLKRHRQAEGLDSIPEEVSKGREAARLAKYEKDPLKHFIRKFAWLESVRQYVKEMQIANVNRPIKYLTLPGAQAIDIGVMWQAGLIHREHGRWPHVAICDNENAADVINNLGEFAAASGKLLHLELSRSQSALVQFFPVDVINLDFWGTFIKQGKDYPNILSNVTTLERILHWQQGQGFLLLLTHKISETEYTPEVRDGFRPLLVDNLQDDRFKKPYVDVFGGDDPALCTKDILRFGLLAVSKVAANMAREFGYTVEEKFVGWYPRDNDYRMCVHSVAFRSISGSRKDTSKNYSPRHHVRRLPNPALSNLSDRDRRIASRNYWEFVSQLPSRKAMDVNDILNGNVELKNTLRQEAEAMQNWWRDLHDDDAKNA